MTLQSVQLPPSSIRYINYGATNLLITLCPKYPLRWFSLKSEAPSFTPTYKLLLQSRWGDWKPINLCVSNIMNISSKTIILLRPQVALLLVMTQWMGIHSLRVPLQPLTQGKVKSFLCLTKYHAMKTYSVLSQAPRHKEVFEGVVYSFTHS
jgi:hypothetical protein